MTFVSLKFVYFLTVVLAARYLLPAGFSRLILLFSSLLFCFWWSPLCLYTITASVLVNFGLGKLIGGLGRKRGRIPVIIGISFNVAALFFFRGYDFFAPELGVLLNSIGLFSGEVLPKILAPVGLSFYSMQAMSWLVDMGRKQVPSDVKLEEFALYMVYFPKLIAGPIERPGPFIRQTRDIPASVSKENLESAGALILLGLFRKVVIADTIRAAIPGGIFSEPQRFTPPELVFWILMLGPCIFNDFAGYTDMARGFSRLLGIELSVNFRSPNFNKGLSDFWTRWHITLSSWLRDYVYFPISRWLLMKNTWASRKAYFFVPAMVTMAVSGMWHGFGVNFLIWGILLGIFAVIEQTVSGAWHRLPFGQSATAVTLRNYTFFGLMFSTLVFFLMDASTAASYLGQLFDWSETTMPNIRLLWLVAPSLWIEWRQFSTGNELFFMQGSILKKTILLSLALVLVLLYIMGGMSSPFVYQAF
jgi:D-alanyl-lipoteichoic acid acyltransferase DltB (MBOAT superfamily)